MVNWDITPLIEALRTRGFSDSQIQTIIPILQSWMITNKDLIVEDITSGDKPKSTWVDMLNDPIVQLSVAAGLGGIAIALNPEVFKQAVLSAGRIAEGFTPGRMTDIGGGD